MKNMLQLHFYAEKEGKKHASLWVNLLCGSLAIYSLLRPGKLNQSCGSNQPTAAFFRLLCFVHLPQKVRGIFALKMRKTGSAAVRSTTTEPVFVDFTVFWAIFALKARKLPDLSGRQIRQLIWRRRRDLNPRTPYGCYTISKRARSAGLRDFSEYKTIFKCSACVL